MRRINYLCEVINIEHNINCTISFHAPSADFENAINLEESSFDYASMMATLEVETYSEDFFDNSLPRPHFDLVAFISETNTYDKHLVSWLQSTILPCETQKNLDGNAFKG